MSKKHTSKTTVRKKQGILFPIMYCAVRVYCFFCGIHIKPVKKYTSKPDSPSIVLYNHGSFIDFIYAASLIWKSRPHFVVARLYFYHRLLGGLLKTLEAFPKSMFALDIECTKNCYRVLKNGGMLVMMPEARLSTAGQFEDIQPNTYSFLKKAGASVYTVKLNGNYFANPKWGKGMRRGSCVEAEFDILFSADELKEISLEQIEQKIYDRLNYDEFEWIKTRPNVRYRSRNLAKGLENILTVCPVCKEKYTITTDKHDIFCKNCGKLTSLDDRYGFDPEFCFENFSQWYNWQKELLKEQILADKDFILSADTELWLPGNGKTLTRLAGTGVCALSRSGLTYRGTRDGEPYEVSFSLRGIYRLLFGAGKNFEIYNGTEILYFVPKIKQSCVEWYMASMILYDEVVGRKP